MSFGLAPFSAGWVSRFKSSIRYGRTCGLKLGPGAPGTQTLFWRWLFETETSVEKGSAK
jgi:hypothetical protein